MSAPVVSQKLHDKNQLDLAIDRFAQLDIFTLTDLNQIGVIAQVQQGVIPRSWLDFAARVLGWIRRSYVTKTIIQVG